VASVVLKRKDQPPVVGALKLRPQTPTSCLRGSTEKGEQFSTFAKTQVLREEVVTIANVSAVGACIIPVIVMSAKSREAKTQTTVVVVMSVTKRVASTKR
jgi:hypothetical protein